MKPQLVFILALLLAGSPGWAWDTNPQEQALAVLLSNEPGQRRPELVFDPVLAEVARGRAIDMGKRNFFNHVNPDGVAADFLVRQAGYALPTWWPTDPKSNGVESIGGGYTSAQAVWSAWMGSAPHHTHLLAVDLDTNQTDTFFAAETHYGIGYAEVPGSKYIHYWVVITAPPGIYISSPKAGAKLPDNSTIVEGTSPPELPVASIEAQLESLSGTSAPVVASGTANWSTSFNGLAHGPSLVRVKAKDAGGEVISEAMVSFAYVELSTLVVSASGSGSITAEFSGTTSREIGSTCQIAATPAKGFVFTGWTGGISSASSVLSFAMPDGLSLQANFIPDPFPAAKGNYTGLLTSGTQGLVKIALQSSGAFSGKVYLGAISYRFSGRFSPLGVADVSVKGMPLDTLHLIFPNDGSEQITGTFTDGAVASGFTADRAVFGKNSPAPLAGKYTFAMTPSVSGSNLPVGASIGFLRINDSGAGMFHGRLADNTPFACAAPITKEGSLPLFARLPRHRGLLSGELAFANLPGSDASGKVRWGQFANLNDPANPNGFTLVLDAAVSSFAAPISLPADFNLSFFGSLVANTPVTLLNTGKSLFPGATPLPISLSANKNTGSISGSFIHPDTADKCLVRAVYLQKKGAAFGFFAGKSKLGGITLLPPGQ